MGLKQRIYSVLIVSAASTFNSSLSSLLPEANYYPIRTASDISSAKRAFAEREYDFVIINSPLPDDQGVRFSIDISSAKEAVVLLLLKSDIHDEVYNKVSEYGVFTLPKPISRSVISTALGWMASARERLRRSEKKTLSIEDKMEEIRLVNRAKWILIGELKMSEPEAHRYIEKQAMDRCVSKREIAEAIIKTYV